MLVPFPIVSLVGAFAGDTLFVWNGEPGWVTASNLLLAVGVGFAALAAIAASPISSAIPSSAGTATRSRKWPRT